MQRDECEYVNCLKLLQRLVPDLPWNKCTHSSRVETTLIQKWSLLGAAAVAEWSRYRIVAGFVPSSSLVPLKSHRVGQRYTINLSRAQTSSHWRGVVVKRGDASSGLIHVT
ncbi:uncharacterized protein TNCV_2037571 [Trichonephila clavipes]|nr:uncharacterized protein TNCV_2037571 [Trichonephila clavipes]